jgi:hypothetical protein
MPLTPRPPHANLGRRAFTFLSYGLAVEALLHVLAVLFTVWSVDWKATALYVGVQQLAQAEYIKVRPPFACMAHGAGCMAHAPTVLAGVHASGGGARLQELTWGRASCYSTGRQHSSRHLDSSSANHSARLTSHTLQVVPAKFSGKKEIVPITIRTLVSPHARHSSQQHAAPHPQLPAPLPRPIHLPKSHIQPHSTNQNPNPTSSPSAPTRRRPAVSPPSAAAATAPTSSR